MSGSDSKSIQDSWGQLILIPVPLLDFIRSQERLQTKTTILQCFPDTEMDENADLVGVWPWSSLWSHTLAFSWSFQRGLISISSVCLCFLCFVFVKKKQKTGREVLTSNASFLYLLLSKVYIQHVRVNEAVGNFCTCFWKFKGKIQFDQILFIHEGKDNFVRDYFKWTWPGMNNTASDNSFPVFCFVKHLTVSIASPACSYSDAYSWLTEDAQWSPSLSFCGGKSISQRNWFKYTL